MVENVGATDQTVRTVVGAVAGIASLAILLGQLTAPAIASPILGVVALLMLGTAATNTCPLYSALGVDTCPRDAGR